MSNTLIDHAQGSILSPICLFAYKRLNELKRTIDALKSNYLAKDSDIYIFCDGPRGIEDKYQVDEVRSYLKSLSGFKNIFVKEYSENVGLSRSIINGVTEVLDVYSSAIVVEDDLVTSPNFLNFMNQAIDFYKNDKSIISISGYTFDLPSVSKDLDYYFGVRSSSWGWATWSDRWLVVDWDLKDVNEILKNSIFKRNFKRGGSDMIKMLKDQQRGKIDSWAIRFCYHQAKFGLYTVFPSISKVRSIGFSKDATHTFGASRFYTNLDKGEKVHFKFDIFTNIDSNIEKEFRNKFSILRRIKGRIIALFQKR